VDVLPLVEKELKMRIDLQRRPGRVFRRMVPLGYASFGDTFRPGDRDVTVELAQRALATLGFSVQPTGVFDDATSAAVLEFRGAAGLGTQNVIDDTFMDRLYTEVDSVGTTDTTPGGGITSGGRTAEINISGKVGMGFGLLLLLGGYYVWKKSQKR
jgi:peptidoglycan hydrolase-like protein with peptidoglycan-binding domain